MRKEVLLACLAFCACRSAGDEAELAATQPSAHVPALYVDTLERVEGDDGARTFLFYIRLTAPSDKPVTVLAETRNGSATGNPLPFGRWRDFRHVSRKLVFAPGRTTQSLPVMVNGDYRREPDEDFEIVLSRPINATIMPGRWRARIMNDDS